MDRTAIVMGVSFFLGIVLMAVGLIVDISWLALVGVAFFCMGFGYMIGMGYLFN